MWTEIDDGRSKIVPYSKLWAEFGRESMLLAVKLHNNELWAAIRL